jgi:hypothetical protein
LAGASTRLASRKTIIGVEAARPFIGPTFLDALPCENVNLSKLYPDGTPDGR